MSNAETTLSPVAYTQFNLYKYYIFMAYNHATKNKDWKKAYKCLRTSSIPITNIKSYLEGRGLTRTSIESPDKWKFEQVPNNFFSCAVNEIRDIIMMMEAYEKNTQEYKFYCAQLEAVQNLIGKWVEYEAEKLPNNNKKGDL